MKMAAKKKVVKKSKVAKVNRKVKAVSKSLTRLAKGAKVKRGKNLKKIFAPKKNVVHRKKQSIDEVAASTSLSNPTLDAGPAAEPIAVTVPAVGDPVDPGPVQTPDPINQEADELAAMDETPYEEDYPDGDVEDDPDDEFDPGAEDPDDEEVA